MPFDWTFFLLLLAGIVSIRFVMLLVIPFRWFSIDTAALLGFFFFFVVPAGFASGFFPIGNIQYAAQVLSAYFAFLLGSGLVILWRPRVTSFAFLRLPVTHTLGRVAIIYCLVFIVGRLVLFFQAGGIGQVVEFWLHGNPVQSYLATFEVGGRTGPASADPIVVLLRVLETFFLAFWGLTFRRAPYLAVGIWFCYLLTMLTDYVGRTVFIIYALVPWACYLVVVRPSIRRLLLQAVAIMCAGLVFMAAASFLRLGQADRIASLGLQQLVEELEVSTRPIIDGTTLLALDARGDSLEYLSSLVALPVPRVLWAGKPLIEFNWDLTALMSGSPVGRNNAILVFTMLGEGWYFLGPAGGFIVMALFGLTAKLFEELFRTSDLFLGSYALLVFNALIQVRSTLQGFYSFGLSTLLTSFGLLVVLKVVWRLASRPGAGEGGRVGLLAAEETPGW